MRKIDLKRLSSLQETALTAGAIAIAAAMLYIFLIEPSLSEINILKIQVRGQQNEIRNKLTQGMTTAKLIEDIKNVETKIDQLYSIYIPENRELELITYLEGIAAKNSIEQNIGINQIDIGSTYFAKIYLQIRAAGEDYAILRYLKDIEKSRYQINIIKADLLNSNKSAVLNISAEAFTIKQQYYGQTKP